MRLVVIALIIVYACLLANSSKVCPEHSREADVNRILKKFEMYLKPSAVPNYIYFRNAIFPIRELIVVSAKNESIIIHCDNSTSNECNWNSNKIFLNKSNWRLVSENKLISNARNQNVTEFNKTYTSLRGFEHINILQTNYSTFWMVQACRGISRISIYNAEAHLVFVERDDTALPIVTYDSTSGEENCVSPEHYCRNASFENDMHANFQILLFLSFMDNVNAKWILFRITIATWQFISAFTLFSGIICGILLYYASRRLRKSRSRSFYRGTHSEQAESEN